jgi:hypothetical protein
MGRACSANGVEEECINNELRQISTCREDSIFNTSCDLWTVTTSFRTLSAVRHADSSARFVCASKRAAHRSPWSADLWTQSTQKKYSLYIYIYICAITHRYFSAPRQLQRYRGNANEGASWQLLTRASYESCLQGIHAKQVTTENIYESKTKLWRLHQ